MLTTVSDDSKQFYLMHKNDVVCSLDIESVSGSILKIYGIKNEALLPPGGNISPQDLKKWWQRRSVPVTQGKISEILENLGLTTPQSLLVSNLGLNLSDHYWIKPLASALKWEDVSLYSNVFVDTIGNLQFSSSTVEICDPHLFSSFSPSASVQGELKKKWICKEDGTRSLIKSNHGLSCQQSINEVFASALHSRQGVMPYTSYAMVELSAQEGSKWGCICDSFTSESLEFISAYDVISSAKKPNSQSVFKFFIELCSSNGLDGHDVRRFLDYQILTDFIISNTDRHLQNLGVLRDSDSLKYVSIAPIFDSGNSMFWNMPKIPGKSGLYTISTRSFKSTELELLNYVTNKDILDLSQLPTGKDLTHHYSRDLNKKRIKDLVLAYTQKIELTHDFQMGKSFFLTR